jgi:hypothetical protein
VCIGQFLGRSQLFIGSKPTQGKRRRGNDAGKTMHTRSSKRVHWLIPGLVTAVHWIETDAGCRGNNAGEIDTGYNDAAWIRGRSDQTDAGETNAGETDAGEIDAGETTQGKRLREI